jgi:hypothetical protein
MIAVEAKPLYEVVEKRPRVARSMACVVPCGSVEQRAVGTPW